MEDIKRFAAVKLTATSTSLYNNSTGAIIKTIALNNTTTQDIEATLNIDGVAFIIPVKTKETKFLNSTMVVNSLSASGEGVNIHVSGIQL